MAMPLNKARKRSKSCGSLAVGEWFTSNSSLRTSILREQSIPVPIIKSNVGDAGMERNYDDRPQYISICKSENDDWSVSTLGWSRAIAMRSGSF